MFQTTRRRLALWYTAVTGVLLLLFAIGFYVYVRHTLIERIDDTLNHVVEVVERSLVIEPSGDGLVWMIDGRVSQRVNVEASFRSNARFANEDDHIDLEWFNPNGKLLWSTFGEPLALPLHIDDLRSPFSHPKGETVTVQPGSYGEPMILRQLTEQVQVGRQVLGYLRVSHPWFEVTKPTQQLVIDLASGLVLVVSGIGAIGWFLSGLAIRPVQESYQRLKQFTADASHELRNPIAVIQTNVQAALVEPDLDQTQQQQLQVVERLTRRLGRLVDDLLFLARQDSGIVQPQWTTVDLDEVLLEVTEEQSRNAMEQGVNLHLSFDDADEGDRFPFRLRGDREQLARLFTNLISNGIQYTPAEGKVQISLQYGEGGKAKGKSGNKILVQVQDTGSGIAPEAMGHVFDRFYRADPARSRQTTTGSGLGLAIAQAIVQNHHGQIRVASSAQQGTTFSVILPIEEEF